MKNINKYISKADKELKYDKTLDYQIYTIGGGVDLDTAEITFKSKLDPYLIAKVKEKNTTKTITYSYYNGSLSDFYLHLEYINVTSDENGLIKVKFDSETQLTFLSFSKIAANSSYSYENPFNVLKVHHYPITYIPLTCRNTFVGSDLTECWHVLRGADWSKSRHYEHMFSECNELKYANVKDYLNSPAVDAVQDLFSYCTKLTHVDLSGLNMTNIAWMNNLFRGNPSLTSVIMPKSKPTRTDIFELATVFNGCTSLVEFNDSSYFNGMGITRLDGMFANCYLLKELDVPKWNTSKCTTMKHLFYGCESLEFLNLTSWDTTNCTNFRGMFYYCISLETLDISNFNTESCKNFQFMFAQCTQLKDLKVNLDFKNISREKDEESNGTSEDGTKLYYYCWEGMFQNCRRLTNVSGTIKNIDFDLDLSYSSNLTVESLNVFRNGMKNITSNHILQLNSKIDTSQIQEIINDLQSVGWTIVYVDK